MTLPDHDPPPKPASGESWADSLPRAIHAAANWGSAASSRHATGDVLPDLDDHLLRDIGLRRDESLAPARQGRRHGRRLSLLVLGNLLSRTS